MGLLSGRKILVTGLLSNRSIAYGIAKAARREGAELALTYQNERFKDRVAGMAREFGSEIALPCEVTSDAEIAGLFQQLKKYWTAWTAWCTPSPSRRAKRSPATSWRASRAKPSRRPHDISAYSFAALVKGALPMMRGRRASLLTLTYLGAERVVPNYNTMGLAKASLEASVRYLRRMPRPHGHPPSTRFRRASQTPRPRGMLRAADAQPSRASAASPSLEARLGEAHGVVVRHDSLRAEIGQREKRRPSPAPSSAARP